VADDEDDNDVMFFRVNDLVTICPRMPAEGETELAFASAEETLFWMARIDGIRSGKDVFGKPLVLVRLQWLYTRHDIRTWFQEDWLMESIKV
jgi:hypothetical protein